MASIRSIAGVVLPVLPVVAVYGFLSLANQDGFADTIAQLYEPGQSLPGTDLPVKQSYTGVKQLDHVLIALVGFFWTVVDGNAPETSLYTFHFVGSMTALWLLLMVESERVGNRWRAVSFLAIWGLTVNTVSFGVTMPTYALVHLLTSPTTMSSGPRAATPPSSVLFVAPSKLAVMPWSIGVGLFVPTVLACLPVSESIPSSLKQNLVAFWQPFPVWVAISQFVLSSISSSLFTTSNKAGPLSHLRRLYSVAAYIGQATHVSSIFLSLIAYIFPTLFAPGVAARLHPATVFLPLPFWSSTIAKGSPGEGSLHMMHWDQALGIAGMVLWALVLYRNAFAYSPKKWEGWFSVLHDSTISFVLEGPAASIIRLVAARDELLLGELTSEGPNKGAGAKR
ncbi:MAG: hypothetical protein M1819_003368 [Sarea resinae]|nr:MAG: hypothetical protein M1819_003368 [Sarea resinae]